jgi:uncharacterized phage-associated protein
MHFVSGPPYSAKAVANFFLEREQDMSSLKLQKLVYFAHGWHWALYDRPLIDERVEAWAWGPVIPSLYHEFKDRGAGPIGRFAEESSITFGGPPAVPGMTPSDHATRQFLERVWRVYGRYTAAQLSNLSHDPNGPWARTDRSVRSNDIPDQLIHQYFNGKLEANRAAG